MELQLGAPAHDHHVLAIKKCAKQMQNFPQSADIVGKLRWHVLHCYLRLPAAAAVARDVAATATATAAADDEIHCQRAEDSADIQVEASDRSDTF